MQQPQGVFEVFVFSVVRPKTHKHYYTMNKKELIGQILRFIITVLTAVLTTFGMASCMGVIL